MSFIRNNFVLVLAFTLPVLLVLVVAAFAYLPSFFLSTRYNFIYTSCDPGSDPYSSYRCDGYLTSLYTVKDGKLVVNPIDIRKDTDRDKIPDSEEGYRVRIFLHDTEKNESREITLAEAQALQLNGLLTSDDGVTVTDDYDRGPEFLFFSNGGSSHGYYLTKGNMKRKLNIVGDNDRYYYRDNFAFLGWVLPGRGE